MLDKLLNELLTTKSTKKYKRGQIIYHEGEAPQQVHIIEHGMIGLFHISETGKETFFRVFSDGDISGHRSMIAEENYHASAIALTDVSLNSLSKDEFHKKCLDNKEINRIIMSTLAHDLGNAELRMSGLLDKTANKRITESLVYLKLKYPDYVWTRREIAEYSGSTYESVTRLMTSLQAKNYIVKVKRDFTISDPQALLSLTEDELSL